MGLSALNADIIALQEVDNPTETLQWINLCSTKYHTMYHKRTNKKQDGLCLAFNKQKFKFYNQQNSKMHVVKLNDLCFGCNSQSNQQYYQKDQIAIYSLLQLHQ